MRYYGQAIHGQCKILLNRQPISRILSDDNTQPQLKKKLELILDIRDYAINELNLPGDKHYLTYVDVKRPYVVWNVFATPEFSIVPKKWCYPIVGCCAYRGYFSKQDAHDYAAILKKQDYDVFIGGVTAYSTLGWFDDPVLNTFVHRSNTRLAALVFHELAHHLLYVSDDTTFNESFATAVEQEGLRRWLKETGKEPALKNYMVDREHHKAFVQLVLKYRNKLELLYARQIPPQQKREAKQSIFNDMKDEYQQLKKQWGGDSGYDSWFNRDLNNARMITVSTYNDLVPAFLRLLETNGNDLNNFYKACQDLSKKPKEERLSILTR